MSIKKYGIYLAYEPTVDLRREGLGRHLAEFLKAAQDRRDIRFIIACPSWMKESLIELFADAGILGDSFEIMAPHKKPLFLLIYEKYAIFKKQSKSRNESIYFYQYIQKFSSSLGSIFWTTVVTTRSKILLGIVSVAILPIFLVAILFGTLLKFISVARKKLSGFCKNIILTRGSEVQKSKKKLDAIGSEVQKSKKKLDAIRSEVQKSKKLDAISEASLSKVVIVNYKDKLNTIDLYKTMRNYEAKLMNNLINSRDDIISWYCPTAFWPDFNSVLAPRLMCVPDVVMIDFPISFAQAGTNRLLDSFRQVEEAIEDGENFVTYSEDVKWRTLVQRYHIDHEKTFVVPHGANILNDIIKIEGSPDSGSAEISFCQGLLKTALRKSINGINDNFVLDVSNIKFIFYASQFRPNKNVFTLLKAYEYLLKRRYISHKLILTGNPNLQGINDFIKAHNLENDVLCLHGLSTQELAACYKLADLAVNPSLSEGGCPFTFTEALSVDTPVVMARIPVTLEVIKDPDLAKDMLFDPYDWKDMADRIEWALQNKEELLAKQKLLYAVLEKRTWRTVVDEYVDILDLIASKASNKDNQKDVA